MSKTQMFRLSGVSLMSGGLIAALGSIVRGIAPDPMQAGWVIGSIIYIVGIMFFLLGLPGMYARQANKAGVIGLVGLVLFFFAVLMLGVGGGTLSILILPWIKATNQAGPSTVETFFLPSLLMVLVGGILLGIGTLRAGIYSRSAGILLIVSIVINFAAQIVPLPYPFVESFSEALVFLALAWLGVGLISQGASETTEFASATPAGVLQK